VIVDPPVDEGDNHLTLANPSPRVTVTLRGAVGAPATAAETREDETPSPEEFAAPTDT
jgi:hypothetical protein